MIKVKKLYLMEGDNKLKAFADLLFFDKITIRGFKLISGVNGLFMALPQTKGRDGKYYNDVWLHDDILRVETEQAIINEFRKQTGGLT